MTNQFIEIFLFVDPMGRRCNSARKVIQQFRSERPEKIKLRVVPMVNFKRVYGHNRNHNSANRASFVDRNNKLLANTYRACLAFHASSMQGKNRALQFLVSLQRYVVEGRMDFSEDLAFEIAQEIGLDMEMFVEDLDSDLAKKMYRKNLQLASDMGITETPSCVIYKDGMHVDAIRLGEEMEREILHSICGLQNILEIDHGEEIHDEVEQELQNVFNIHG